MPFITPFDILHACLKYHEPAYLAAYLNENTTYQTDWFGIKAIGKEAILQHLHAKFSTLSVLQQSQLLKIKLFQTSTSLELQILENDCIRHFEVEFEFDQGKFIRIYLRQTNI